MNPFPPPHEISLRQRICREAWALSSLAFGKEKMKLIAEAFPFAIERTPSEGVLWIQWHPRLKSFTVSDFGGFVTMVPEDDLEVLIEAIKMEFHQAGAFRESITGEKARPKQRVPVGKPARTQKAHISLGDLGL